MPSVESAPNVGKDADDTAKGIVSLALLDPSGTQAQRSASLAEAMISHFEVESHFQTYESERDPSFSTNCNALQALLCQPAPSRYKAQIWKIAEFLSNSWWESHRAPEDKWVGHLFSPGSGYWMLIFINSSLHRTSRLFITPCL